MTIAALAGCADPTRTGVSGVETSSPPTTATHEPRLVDESDRPLVAFDPCLDIPDDVLVTVGYDPKSEDNADFAATHYTMLGCSYDGTAIIPGVAAYGLTVMSANFDWTIELQKVADNGDNVIPTEILGRRALRKTNHSLPESCGMSVETSYGVLIFAQVLFGKAGARVPEAQWCTGLEDTAERIVAVLDDVESRTR
ncbi:DUF3558 domain-containing protein [Rhodococcus aetherivorans]|uniref:DUF3558 domain-containing protein n=1 Tax=Rhodococcus aetherivorans TaxID=191292 RepID=UPI001E2E8F5E|nr:DUF3558 domain-containing protein [Rhodococcus aetherivorans]UGQ39613.1 DUF3558 domain-containing protein [Rhodococcus aetherivorans]